MFWIPCLTIRLFAKCGLAKSLLHALPDLNSDSDDAAPDLVGKLTNILFILANADTVVKKIMAAPETLKGNALIYTVYNYCSDD